MFYLRANVDLFKIGVQLRLLFAKVNAWQILGNRQKGEVQTKKPRFANEFRRNARILSVAKIRYAKAAFDDYTYSKTLASH